MKSVTTNQQGDVVATTIEQGTATVFFGRKNGLGNYSNEEMGIHLQVPIGDLGALGDEKKQMEVLEATLDPHVAFLKAYVYRQLGVPFEVDAQTNVVMGEKPPETPKKNTKGTKQQTNRPEKTTYADKEAMWRALSEAASVTVKEKSAWRTEDDNLFWDNREGKTNPRSPDFKHAESGDGLWLEDAPSWFTGPGEGEVH